MRQYLGAQGEVNIFKIDAIPEEGLQPVERTGAGHAIIGHSESGHHHVLCGESAVLERTKDVPQGLRVLYALLDEPGELKNEAPHPHENFALPPGFYEFRVSREYDPFAEQARRVAD